jgi:intracellular septation protein
MANGHYRKTSILPLAKGPWLSSANNPNGKLNPSTDSLTKNGSRNQTNKWQFLFLLTPVLLFTFIEEYYGVVWGTVAALIVGIAEIIYEKIRYQKVSAITWGMNALIVLLGLVSIYLQDGIWFKLQLALFEIIFAGLLIGSSLLKKPLLLELAKKQNQNMAPEAIQLLNGINFRLGIFFIIQAGIATWAAYTWSSVAWAFLKTAGLILMMFAYMLGEFLFVVIKRKLTK